MSENEREIQALVAIIVSQLMREREPMILDDLPELTDAPIPRFAGKRPAHFSIARPAD